MSRKGQWLLVRKWLELEHIFAPLLLKRALEEVASGAGNSHVQTKAKNKVEEINSLLKRQTESLFIQLEEGYTAIICERSDDLTANSLRILASIHGKRTREESARIFAQILCKAAHVTTCRCKDNVAKLEAFWKKPKKPKGLPVGDHELETCPC